MSTSPLQAFRRERDLDLDQAAALFGVNRSTFFRWETGRIPSDRVVEVAQKTGIAREKLRPDLYGEPEVAA